VRLVVVMTIIIIVPFIALFLLITLLISAPVFNLATCISGADDVTQAAIVSVASLAALLPWSDCNTLIFRKI
jgi:hypothetical protein